jgi:hypothetical protein
MLALQKKHPEIYAEFDKGNFTVRKTDSKFSNIAIDQAIFGIQTIQIW